MSSDKEYVIKQCGKTEMIVRVPSQAKAVFFSQDCSVVISDSTGLIAAFSDVAVFIERGKVTIGT